MITLLRKIFFLRQIYSRKTAAAIISDSTLMAFVVILLGIRLYNYQPLPILLLLGFIYMTLRSAVKSYIALNRITNSPNKMPLDSVSTSPYLGASQQELDKAAKPREVQLLDQGAYWKLYDTIFNFYRHTKYGDYVSKQVYYTVCEIQLRRQVPNLVFDSKRAKGQQFRYQYLQSQCLSFEGDFNHYFTVYAPDYYEIDTLSFITPEVMESMISAADYDIELIGDRLLLYAPLLDPSEFSRIETNGQNLAKELNDNLDTYTDSYLGDDSRKTAVTPFARQLLKSPMRPALHLAAGLSALGVLIYFGLTESTGFLRNQISFIVYIYVISSAHQVIKTLVDNHRALTAFQADRQFIQEHPERN